MLISDLPAITVTGPAPTGLAFLAVVATLIAALVAALVVVALRRDKPLVSPRRGDRVGAGQVVVVSGSYGAGHDAAARRIAEEVRACGGEAVVLDIVDCYPLGTGRLLKRAYFLQLSACPSSWGHVLNVLASDSPLARFVSRGVVGALAWLPARRLLAAVPAGSALIVSTHPFASAALGRLRRRGQLDATITTYLTDPSVHALWVHRGVDVHLAIYPDAARQARALGAERVRLIRPLVMGSSPVPQQRRVRNDVLGRLGVPIDRPVVLVVGGSEGVGDLAASALDVAGTGLATAVVACGHNETLRTELARVPGVVALAWQDGLTDLVSVADCVVQNAGGFTALEAMALGTPVTSYRCLPGHGSANAAALEADGLAAWPHDVGALIDALTDALSAALCADRVAPDDWADRATFADVLGLAPVVLVAR